MMSAALHAPLAALITVFELTANPYLILPAMLAIVSANITAREVFKQESVFSMLMSDAGLDYRNDPIAQNLRRIGVAAVMNRSFVEAEQIILVDAVADLLSDTPQWIIVRNEQARKTLLPASDLARYMEEAPTGEIDLMEIPGQRLELVGLHLQSTMHEAKEAIDDGAG